MTDLQNLPTMPATDCPDWCRADHAAQWLRRFAIGRDQSPIGTAGGGFLPRVTPSDEWLTADFLQCLSHTASVLYLELEAACCAEVDMAQAVGEPLCLYLDAQGPITPEQARQVASALITAAARVEALS